MDQDREDYAEPDSSPKPPPNPAPLRTAVLIAAGFMLGMAFAYVVLRATR